MRTRAWRLIALAAPLLALLGALALGAPVARAHGVAPARPLHALHALLVRSDPKADAILAAPPSQVRAWFSEAVNPYASSLVVIDPSNHEVDTRDSHVSPSDPAEMLTSLQLLRPGAYIVIWRTQSAADGHVTGGSFIFRVANADGSVPPVPATLPTARIPGAAGYGATPAAFDGPIAAQALFTWLALLFLTFWVGGLIWETWVAPASAAADDAAGEGALRAARRFRLLAPYALGGLALANLGLAAALTVEVAGGARGLIEPQFWRATLFGDQFGVYWWMRQAAALASLILLLIASRDPSDVAAQLAAPRPAAAPERSAGDPPQPTWTREALATVGMIRHLPRRLVRGWFALSVTGQIELGLAALLLVAFAMSGHAGATPPSERAYAVIVDLLHLVFESAWLGGLLYISAVLIPASKGLIDRERALLLARGVPAFSALALFSATVLALTGSLNTSIHFTAISQFITTTYGRTLAVKIEIFIVMVIISAYHAFSVRPRLATALAADGTPAVVEAPVGARGAVEHGVEGVTPPPAAEDKPPAFPPDPPISTAARALATRMEDWLRREALLGGGVLLCVALLAAFAGSLAPAVKAIPASSGAYSATHTASGYTVKLDISPASFGANTFTVTITDPQGQLVNNASVLVLTENSDMDMGSGSLQLKWAGSAQPGVYAGGGDLTMAGNWRITVKVLPHGASDYLSTDFTLLVGSQAAG